MPASIRAWALMISSRQLRRFVAEQSSQLPQRLPALSVRVGVNKIVEDLPPLSDRALPFSNARSGEFSRLRRTHSLDGRQFREDSKPATARPP